MLHSETTHRSFTAPPNQEVIRGVNFWKETLHFRMNLNALQWLLNDEPEKRRKVYLEFNSSDNQAILNDLQQAGFTLDTVKPIHKRNSIKSPTPEVLSCLITGKALTILRFLRRSPKILLVSIDLPEYSWLSSRHGVAKPFCQNLCSLQQ